MPPIDNIFSLSLLIDYDKTYKLLYCNYSFLRLLSYPIAFGNSVNPLFRRSSCCLLIRLPQLSTPAALTNFCLRDSYFTLSFSLSFSSLNFMFRYYLFWNPFSISTLYLCNCWANSSNFYFILYFSSALASYVSSFRIFIWLSVSYVSRQHSLLIMVSKVLIVYCTACFHSDYYWFCLSEFLFISSSIIFLISVIWLSTFT